MNYIVEPEGSADARKSANHDLQNKIKFSWLFTISVINFFDYMAVKLQTELHLS